MIRILLGAVLGGIGLFAWGFVYWVTMFTVILPPTPMTDQAAVVAGLQAGLPETGVYWIPEMIFEEGATPETVQATTEAWTEQHRQGPLAMIIYNADGRDPQDKQMLVRGVVIDMVAALLASMLLFAAAEGRGFGARWLFVLGLGLLMAVAVHAVYWNFMYVPTEFTLFKAGDSVGGWLVAGLLIAAVVKRGGHVMSAD